jgi:hypothetical protein
MATGSIFEQMIDPANRADPWPLYRELRKTPVTRETDGTYVVSRYRDIVALIHDPRVSAAGGVALPGRLVNLDPPAHDRIRQSLMRHYGPPEAPGRIESMRADLQDIVTGLIDRLAGKNQADLVDEFASALPVTAICRLLGVPVEDEPRFHAWADAIVANIRLQGTAAEDARRKRDDAFADMDRYFGALADARREAPAPPPAHRPATVPAQPPATRPAAPAHRVRPHPARPRIRPSWRHVALAPIRKLARSIRVNSVHPTTVAAPVLLSPVNFGMFRPDLEDPALEEFEPVDRTFNVLPVPCLGPARLKRRWPGCPASSGRRRS